MLSKKLQRTEASISSSNVLEPVQLKLILKLVDGLFHQGASQASMVVKKPRAERGALSRFSAGVSVSSPEGQKQILERYAITMAPIPTLIAERKPWVAGVLSGFLPGLGHLYVGRWVLAVCWYASYLLLVLAFGLVARSPLLPPALNLGGILLPLAGYVLVTLSAIRHARDVRKSYSIKPFNRWYVYLCVFGVGASIFSFLSDAGKEFVIKAYKIPSGTMMPTLLIGDHIYVDNLIYRLGKHPERGDVIVFKFPEDETKDFIKRIVGIPGDAIEIRNKEVILNGSPIVDHSFTQRIDPEIIDRSVNPRDNFGPITVPNNSYFVLGDNRDQSLDSRFWGYVDASKIRGKATTVYWSWSGMGEWYEWVRWERISQRIH